MVAHIHTPNIRRIYSRPWRNGRSANAGKVPTGIQVAVRPETTVCAHETMLAALAEMAAAGTHLAGIGRVHVFDRDARRSCLVLDEGLKLSPCPAVQAAAHALTSLDPRADMRQIFHRDLGDTGFDRCLNDGLARFVVCVLHAPHLLAGDLPELLFRARAAVGLKTAAQGQVTVAPIAQVLAAEDLAQAMGGEIVFSDIHTHYGAECHGFCVVGLDDEIEEPSPFAQHQFRFLVSSGFENPTLMLSWAQRDADTPTEG